MPASFMSDTDHYNPHEFSSSRPSSAWDNFFSAKEQQYRVDSFFSLEDELYQRWQQNVAEYEATTQRPLPKFQESAVAGGRTSLGPWQAMRAAANRASGESPYPSYQPDNLPTDAALKVIDDTDAAIVTARQVNPKLKTFAEILDEVKLLRQNVEQKNADNYEGAGLGGVLAGFAGSAVGSFSLRDPLFLGSLSVGGFGRSIAQRIITEAAVAGSIGAAQEFTSVQPTRELLDEPYRDPLNTIATFALGAGAIRGGFEAVGFATRSLIRQTGARLPPIERDIDFEDAQLREMLGQLPDTPNTRAAESFLDDAASLRHANPYGATHEAELRFSEELFQARARANGETAVGRFIPNEPFYLADDTADMLIARGERPDLVAKLDEARAKVEEVTSRVDALDQALSSRTIGDAVALADDVSGQLVKGYEARLAEPNVGAAERTDLLRRIDQIVESIGAEKIARLENDARIGPKKELGSTRGSLKAARREYNAARDDVDRVLKSIRDREKVKDLLHATDAKASAAILRETPTFAGTPVPRSPDVVAELPAHAARADAEIPQVVDEFMAGNHAPKVEPVEGAPKTEGPPPLTPPLRTDGLVDLGNGQLVPDDFVFDLPEGQFTARQLLEDFAEDDAMLAAMKVCSI